MTTFAYRVAFPALAAFLLLSVAATSGTSAAVLVLNSGQSITIDTDALTITGDVTEGGAVFDGAAVFAFDAIHLAAGSTVTLQGSKPLQLLSYSDFFIDTTLAANGGAGVANTSTPGDAGFGGVGILGGGGGGRAGQSTGVDGTNGVGPGAGGGQLGCCGGGTGAGYGGVGGNTHDPNPSIPQGPSYGNAEITELLAGSGGGGGAGDNPCCFAQGSGGGAGGGAIGLVALGNLHLGSAASIQVNGGTTAPASRSGGGGSGGAIRLVGDNVTLDAGSSLSADGGSLPSTGSRAGGAGGGGRIAVFSATSLTNNGTQSVAAGTGGYNGTGSVALQPAQPGTTHFGAFDGLTTSLDLGTGSFRLAIDTDLGVAAYTGDRVGFLQATISGGVATFDLDSISLGPDVEVVVSGGNMLALHSQGDVSINTTIDASGGDGQARTGASGGVGGTAPGGLGVLGGGDGGRGGLGTSSTPGLDGEGPGGGGGQESCCGGGAGGGFGGMGGYPRTDTASALPVGITYGDDFLSTLVAGSGGGGGAGTNTCCTDGGGGGAGGGAIEIASLAGSIVIGPDGEILVNGGDGGGNRAGGGGSGGALRLIAGGDISIDGLLSADGGISHLTSARGGGGGGGGRIYLSARSLLLGGVAQDPGYFVSNAWLSALGGAGSSHPQGGTAGFDGTILFTVPEPSSLVALGCLGLALAGLFGRRRSGRRAASRSV